MGNSNVVFLYMALLLVEGSAEMVMIMQQKRYENVYSFPMIPRYLVSQPRPRHLSGCRLKPLWLFNYFRTRNWDGLRNR